MINEEKVRIMTNLEIYETTKGRRQFNIIKYYKRDYVRYHMFRTAVAATVAFLIFLGIYVLMNFEMLIDSINDLDFMEMGKKIGVMYLVFLAFYILVAWLVYSIRYNKVKPDVINYSRNLKRLRRIYEKEEKELNEIRAGKGVRSTDENIDNY